MLFQASKQSTVINTAPKAQQFNMSLNVDIQAPSQDGQLQTGWNSINLTRQDYANIKFSTVAVDKIISGLIAHKGEPGEYNSSEAVEITHEFKKNLNSQLQINEHRLDVAATLNIRTYLNLDFKLTVSKEGLMSLTVSHTDGSTHYIDESAVIKDFLHPKFPCYQFTNGADLHDPTTIEELLFLQGFFEFMRYLTDSKLVAITSLSELKYKAHLTTLQKQIESLESNPIQYGFTYQLASKKIKLYLAALPAGQDQAIEHHNTVAKKLFTMLEKYSTAIQQSEYGLHSADASVFGFNDKTTGPAPILVPRQNHYIFNGLPSLLILSLKKNIDQAFLTRIQSELLLQIAQDSRL